ncbi:E3 ubiquitin-protein ligase TRIM39-like isoform X1 [Genypterus blacodes]|uniref:E3 ubiquitin-protein ligase TRIM39-like isoform X1 n=1 Tax=Genypterus blacodes TaxID=154954 RepID=UPI003F7681A2
MNKVPFTPDASSLLMQDTAQVTPALNYRKRRSINQVILQRNRKRVRESESRAAVDWTEAEEKPEDQKFVHSTAASQPNSADMSAASRLQSEDQFLCSICLDVFTDPVSTSCGHNFCRTCITQHWDSNVQCVCPLCKKMFHTRPELEVNRLLSEVAAEFRQSRQNEASRRSEEPAAKPGEVQCDVCTGTKLKAIKSCLKCEASYCQTHLEPHLTAARLRSHQLIHPVDNLEDRMCKKHKKPLELFCKTDQTCVCSLCPVLDHKNHEFVPLEEEYEGKKSELEKTEAEIQQKMQQTCLKIQGINQSEKLSREAADRKKAEGLQIFTTLKQHVEDIQADFMETVEEKQRSTKKQAEDFIRELQQELSEQRERAAEVEKLLLSEDHLDLLQSFSSISCAPPTKDWTEVRVHQRSHEGSLVKAVAQLEETISKEVKELLKVELRRIQQFAVDVTLDPDTAQPKLILSDDGKQVYCGDVRKKLPDKPQRFEAVCVLGKQSFSSRRFYFEVQVKGKTEWDVGVTRETSERKGRITLNPQRGYWTVILRNEDKFSACDDAPVLLSLKSKPEKVGVFVDYEEGLVSFYDVDAAALIFSFTGCSFTHKLLPYFSPSPNLGGRNSAPLIISAVSHPE